MAAISFQVDKAGSIIRDGIISLQPDGSPAIANVVVDGNATPQSQFTDAATGYVTVPPDSFDLPSGAYNLIWTVSDSLTGTFTLLFYVNNKLQKPVPPPYKTSDPVGCFAFTLP